MRVLWQSRSLAVTRQLATTSFLSSKKHRHLPKRPTPGQQPRMNVLSKLSAIAMKVSHQDNANQPRRNSKLSYTRSAILIVVRSPEHTAPTISNGGTDKKGQSRLCV